jgi:hypothetical protein
MKSVPLTRTCGSAGFVVDTTRLPRSGTDHIRFVKRIVVRQEIAKQYLAEALSSFRAYKTPR